jgi:hypothetical protein
MFSVVTDVPKFDFWHVINEIPNEWSVKKVMQWYANVSDSISTYVFPATAVENVNVLHPFRAGKVRSLEFYNLFLITRLSGHLVTAAVIKYAIEGHAVDTLSLHIIELSVRAAVRD